MACDPEGPVMMFISKMVYPHLIQVDSMLSEGSSQGKSLKEKKYVLWDLIVNTENKKIYMIRIVYDVVDTCALEGVDQYLVKKGTI